MSNGHYTALVEVNDVLSKALEQYTHCRHASINCFCTKEARWALCEAHYISNNHATQPKEETTNVTK